MMNVEEYVEEWGAERVREKRDHQVEVTDELRFVG